LTIGGAWWPSLVPVAYDQASVSLPTLLTSMLFSGL
jgi:hypothetical protein